MGVGISENLRSQLLLCLNVRFTAFHVVLMDSYSIKLRSAIKMNRTVTHVAPVCTHCLIQMRTKRHLQSSLSEIHRLLKLMTICSALCNTKGCWTVKSALKWVRPCVGGKIQHSINSQLDKFKFGDSSFFLHFWKAPSIYWWKVKNMTLLGASFSLFLLSNSRKNANWYYFLATNGVRKI